MFLIWVIPIGPSAFSWVCLNPVYCSF